MSYNQTELTDELDACFWFQCDVRAQHILAYDDEILRCLLLLPLLQCLVANHPSTASELDPEHPARQREKDGYSESRRLVGPRSGIRRIPTRSKHSCPVCGVVVGASEDEGLVREVVGPIGVDRPDWEVASAVPA